MQTISLLSIVNATLLLLHEIESAGLLAVSGAFSFRDLI